MTESRKLVVVGASGCGRQTLDVVEAVNDAAASPVYDLVGVLDDAPSDVNLQRLDERAARYLGQVAEWLATAEPHYYSVGIGNPLIRRRIARMFDAAGHRAATLIDPRANLGTRASIAEGVVIRAGAQLSTNVTLGRHTYVNLSAVIGHDTICQDYVSVNPGALVSGQCAIGEGTLIGAGAVIIQGLQIGRDAVVGAAACVTRSVPDGHLAKGVPARAEPISHGLRRSPAPGAGPR